MDSSLPGFSDHGIFQARILNVLSFPSPGDLPTQGSNLGLLDYRQILYQLSQNVDQFENIRRAGTAGMERWKEKMIGHELGVEWGHETSQSVGRTRHRISVPTEGEESMEKAKEKVFAQERMRLKKEGMFMKSSEARIK